MHILQRMLSVSMPPIERIKFIIFCDAIILQSDLAANVHFLSDMDMAKELAKDIIEHNLLKNI
jgi:hypothetical protein